jgi:cation transport regulator
MPWKSNDELPSGVKDNISDEPGKAIFRAAFNAALKQYDDEQKAMMVAWAALKKSGYEKGKDDKWHKVEQTTPEIRMEFAKQLGNFEETKEGLVGAFEVFKTGTWGDKPWTEKEIDEILQNFSSGAFGSPVAVMHTTWDGRHSYSDKDVCGQVLDLKKEPNKDKSVSMFAKMLFSEPVTADKVKRKEPDQFSVSLSQTDNGWMLKHIALTPIPGVKGLRGTIPLHEFTQSKEETSILLVNTVAPETKQEAPPDDLQPPEPELRTDDKNGKETHEMSEEEKNKLVEMTEEVRSLKELTATQKEELDKKEIELTAFRTAKKSQEFSAKLDVLVGEARITPAIKAKVLPLLMGMDDTVELTEGDQKVKPTDAFLATLAELPVIGITGDKGLGFTQKPPQSTTTELTQAKLTETARQMIKESGAPVKE